MKFAWIDLRTVPDEQRESIVDAAIHAGVEAIVDDSPQTLRTLPPTVLKVLAGPHDDVADLGDYVLLEEVGDERGITEVLSRPRPQGQTGGAVVNVTDDPSLTLACQSASRLPYTVVQFKDPTKIPLEIVIAAADKAPGTLICRAEELDEARIIIDVLEKGSEGVLLAPRDANDVFRLVAAMRATTSPLTLQKLHVTAIEHSGLGDRVCVDTCTHFEKDEGILVGSYSHGFILCSSETHPLPYMPTRPFRVNAGALHSYVVGQDNRTNYLSELKAGSTVLAVGADGRTRRVVVGRIKLESRPLLTIRAAAEDGAEVTLIVQDDWHVRVLGPGGTVLNVTELKPGDELLGYIATDQRHVGWPVGEFCVEK
ncbi:3-dehydroquinate synthase II [Dactylosporangium vinaceum]|uniref:3-dehydroquinate synthase II family protein n=1 Tax=Dactylosporangium vinaceum TaxID=53362 RepID=A0ABV5MEE0_9ACTN|nr:3-dehydroquinate synthase II [Dactylosporangium vinaceum]UAB92426.1 3-dehydroquinate synthase II [Dactylosporangium vinaceum]